MILYLQMAESPKDLKPSAGQRNPFLPLDIRTMLDLPIRYTLIKNLSNTLHISLMGPAFRRNVEFLKIHLST